MTEKANLQIDQALELLKGQIKFLENLNGVLAHQLLSNADQLESVIRDTKGIDHESRIRLLTIVRDSIKEPIRRQNSRVTIHLEAVRSASEKIQRAGESLPESKE